MQTLFKNVISRVLCTPSPFSLCFHRVTLHVVYPVSLDNCASISRGGTVKSLWNDSVLLAKPTLDALALSHTDQQTYSSLYISRVVKYSIQDDPPTLWYVQLFVLLYSNGIEYVVRTSCLVGAAKRTVKALIWSGSQRQPIQGMNEVYHEESKADGW